MSFSKMIFGFWHCQKLLSQEFQKLFNDKHIAISKEKVRKDVTKLLNFTTEQMKIAMQNQHTYSYCVSTNDEEI
jgi:hypothetical protein